jgi:hypothetical protein
MWSVQSLELKIKEKFKLSLLPLSEKRAFAIDQIEGANKDIAAYLKVALPNTVGKIKILQGQEQVQVNGIYIAIGSNFLFPDVPLKFSFLSTHDHLMQLIINSETAEVRIPFDHCEIFIPKIKPITSDRVSQELNQIDGIGKIQDRVTLNTLPRYSVGNYTICYAKSNKSTGPLNSLKQVDIIQGNSQNHLFNLYPKPRSCNVDEAINNYVNQRLLWKSSIDSDFCNFAIKLSPEKLVDAFYYRVKNFFSTANEFGNDCGINVGIANVIKRITVANASEMSKLNIAESIELLISRVPIEQRALWGDIYKQIAEERGSVTDFLLQRWDKASEDQSIAGRKYTSLAMLVHEVTLDKQLDQDHDLYLASQLVHIPYSKNIDLAFRLSVSRNDKLVFALVMENSNYEYRFQMLFEGIWLGNLSASERSFLIASFLDNSKDPWVKKLNDTISNLIDANTNAENLSVGAVNSLIYNFINCAFENERLGIEFIKRVFATNPKLVESIATLSKHGDIETENHVLELLAQSPTEKVFNFGLSSIQQLSLLRRSIERLKDHDLAFLQADLSSEFPKENFNFTRYISETFGSMAANIAYTKPTESIISFINSGTKEDLRRLLNLNRIHLSPPVDLSEVTFIFSELSYSFKRSNLKPNSIADYLVDELFLHDTTIVSQFINRTARSQINGLKLLIDLFNSDDSRKLKIKCHLVLATYTPDNTSAARTLTKFFTQNPLTTDLLLELPESYLFSFRKNFRQLLDTVLQSKYQYLKPRMMIKQYVEESPEYSFCDLPSDYSTRNLFVAQAIDILVNSSDLGINNNISKFLLSAINSLSYKERNMLLAKFYLANDTNTLRDSFTAIINS